MWQTQGWSLFAYMGNRQINGSVLLCFIVNIKIDVHLAFCASLLTQAA